MFTGRTSVLVACDHPSVLARLASEMPVLGDAPVPAA
jgi:hypothetical protein